MSKAEPLRQPPWDALRGVDYLWSTIPFVYVVTLTMWKPLPVPSTAQEQEPTS